MWLRFLCLTCGINEAPPSEVDGKSPQRALAQGTSGSPPASTSCPALETCDTEAAATTVLPPATLATLTPPYVRRHQRTITLDGSEGSFISVGVPAADCFGNEAADPGRSDGGGGSPSHASALAAGAAAASGTARMSRNSPALPGHHGHRRGAVTAGGGLGGGGGGGATCSPPSWARRPGSAKALAYGSGGGAATASASTPAVPSRFSLNGAAPVSRGAYGYTGAPTTTTTTADCGSISTGSMCGGVGCGGGYGGRTAGGGVTDGGCPPSQQPQLQRPSGGGGGGRLHRRYYAPATSGTDPAADAAAAAAADTATAADSAATGTAVRLDGWPGFADDAAQDAAAASSALQQAATAAACRHMAKAHATADAADADADADASSAHQAVAAAAAAVAGVEAGGDTTANEADAEDNSSIDSAATVVLVEREAEAGGAAATAGEFGMGPTTQLPWGPNAAQRTLLPSHPQQLLRYAPLLPLQGPRSLLPSAAGPAAAANSVRPWRSCKDSDAAASAPASGVQQPLAASGTSGERGAATAVAGSAAEPAKAEVVATVDYKEQPWEQDRAAALQQQCRELLQQFPPPLPFAPSSSKLLMKEACPPRRTVTGSSFGSCNNSISLRVDLSGNGGLGVLVGDRDDDVGDDRGVAEGGAAACGSAPHGVVFATRMGAAVVA